LDFLLLIKTNSIKYSNLYRQRIMTSAWKLMKVLILLDLDCNLMIQTLQSLNLRSRNWIRKVSNRNKDLRHLYWEEMLTQTTTKISRIHRKQIISLLSWKKISSLMVLKQKLQLTLVSSILNRSSTISINLPYPSQNWMIRSLLTFSVPNTER